MLRSTYISPEIIKLANVSVWVLIGYYVFNNLYLISGLSKSFARTFVKM